MQEPFVKSVVRIGKTVVPSSDMDSKEAKDFLVQQVTEQAALEGLSLSEIEKKMMYFTESDPSSCEIPSR